MPTILAIIIAFINMKQKEMRSLLVCMNLSNEVLGAVILYSIGPALLASQMELPTHCTQIQTPDIAWTHVQCITPNTSPDNMSNRYCGSS